MTMNAVQRYLEVRKKFNDHYRYYIWLQNLGLHETALFLFQAIDRDIDLEF